MNRRLLVILGGGTAAIALLVLIAFAGGCFRTKEPVEVQTFEPIELTYYKLFDDSDVINPLIQEYQAKNANVKVRYRKFVDPEEYYDLILNELAEGRGPDIFSVPNTWFLRNHRKVSPAPENTIPPDAFEVTYVSVTYDDLVRVNPDTGKRMVYGLPMTVDTLALYYNKDHFEDSIPERGRPSITWEGIKEDVFTLTKRDQSFERFEVAGIAMGHADNIIRAADIMYLLILQHGGSFYDESMSEAIFANQQGVANDGRPIRPGVQALELYTSFANPANKNYSWNQYLSDANSQEKEIRTFARGKVSMVIGYSNMYEQIINEINDLRSRGLSAITPDSIRIAMIPQVTDPAVATAKRDTYANYFVETVARTSENSEWAWDFLLFLTSRDSLAHYNEKTNRPTSRRDMIEEQKDDPIYGVFAEQIGFAESIPIYDKARYDQIILKAINDVLATRSVQDAVRTAQDEINDILPPAGLQPQVTAPQGLNE